MKKKLYKIGYITKLLGITPRTIRYYDQCGLLRHVKRSHGNIRLFDDEDIALIKQIRRYQKNEFLPLEEIRDRLFGKDRNDPDFSVAVVTDSAALISTSCLADFPVVVLPLKIKSKGQYLHEIPADSASFWPQQEALWKNMDAHASYEVSVDAFVAQFLALSDQGVRCIYSVHLSSSLSSTVSHAVEAAHRVADKVEVIVIDSMTVGAGLGLLVENIAESVAKNASKNELRLLISKQTPLLFSLVMLNSMNLWVRPSTLGPAKIGLNAYANEIMNLKPIFVFKEGRGYPIFQECCSTKEKALATLLDRFSEEINTRGRYVGKIRVSYHFLYGEAIEMVNRLKAMIPDVPISLEAHNVSFCTYFGPETLSISIC